MRLSERNETMTTNQRRNLHHTINALTPDQVAAIVRRTHPRVKSGQVDTIAKASHRGSPSPGVAAQDSDQVNQTTSMASR